jgi:tetratricopeptide (TPR) repeat protein
MKRTANLGLFLLLTLAVAIPTLAQQEAPDVTAYRTLYGEKDPAKQADLAEKFLNESGQAFKDSMYRENAFLLMSQSYLALKNWDKVMAAAEKVDQLVPNAKPATKLRTNLQAMVVAQQANNVQKTIEFGDKVLAQDPNNINALITLAPMIVAKLPEDAAAKDAALAKSMEYAKKALAQPKPMGVADAQWAAVQGQMHSTIGFAHLNKQLYSEAIAEYEQALKNDPKDAVDQWRLGLAYQGLARAAQAPIVGIVDKENELKRATPLDQAAIDELAAKRTSLMADFTEKRDKAIDALAKAVAIGGEVGPLARPTLESLWKNKDPNGTLTGLDDFIAQKKKELGV